jgi:hypothetical protein
MMEVKGLASLIPWCLTFTCQHALYDCGNAYVKPVDMFWHDEYLICLEDDTNW